MSKKRKKTKKQTQDEIIRVIHAVLLIALSLIGFFRLGLLGIFINRVMRVLFGHYPYVYYMLIGVFALMLAFNYTKIFKSWRQGVALILIYLSWMLFISIPDNRELVGMAAWSDYFGRIQDIYRFADAHAGGGLVGSLLFSIVSVLVAREGVYIVIAALLAISLVLSLTPSTIFARATKINQSIRRFFKNSKEKRGRARDYAPFDDDDVIDQSENILEDRQEVSPPAPGLVPSSKIFMDVDNLIVDSEASDVFSQLPPDDELPLSPHFINYSLPKLNLLEGKKGQSRSSANETSAKAKGKRLIEVLQQFGIDATLINTHIGPAVTKFELKPDSNVKISKISSIQDNLMMELAVKALRIEAPIPGRSAVGIEVPNVEMTPVRMKEIILNTPSFFSSEHIQVALGKNLMGEPISISLNKMPHLLIAGATGSGKSVCMNSIITSILLSKKPDELKLMLIDPKKVEFKQFEKIPHLLCPVISDPKHAAAALSKIVEEMESRYDVFNKVSVRNLASFNDKVKNHPNDDLKPMPWIVVIIDELADLMAVSGKDVEMHIQRITQLARAAGIHLIVATQRPSVDVVTGIIKANIPSRIAFAVSSAVDSRTIIDTIGAEKLLGYGDMLYIPMGDPSPTRVQGVLVTDDEVRRVADRASSQAIPVYYDAFMSLEGKDGNQGFVQAMDDPMVQEAQKYVISVQKASTSLLQRRFQIGYNRAARIIETLEENGVIGPAQGSKPRAVLIAKDSEKH